MKLLILGASGLVGRNVLEQALGNPAILQVIAPTRRVLPPHFKLINPVTPQLDLILTDVATWRVDAVICALGTTKDKARSKQAFRQVDYVLPLAFARETKNLGAEIFALVSAIGASAESSFFYARTKGEVERDIALVGFKSLYIFRPSIIGGERDERRLAEAFAIRFSSIFRSILPKKFHVNPAARIASAMLEAVVSSKPGLHFRYAESLS